MIPNLKINTYRELKMPRFEETRAALQQMIPQQPLADYGGVFYFSSNQQRDYHEYIIRISSLRQDLQDMGLLKFWQSTALISTTQELGIHGDGDPRFSYRLVIPVWNTENTFTEFYKANVAPEETVLKHKDHDVIYASYDIDQCKLIDRVEILTPTIINVDVPHRVVHASNNNNVRITAAISLYGHEEVEEVFASIFNEHI